MPLTLQRTFLRRNAGIETKDFQKICAPAFAKAGARCNETGVILFFAGEKSHLRLAYRVRALQFSLQIHRSGTAVGTQWRKRGKPQYAGSYLCPDCCVGRRSARLSLLPFCQTASAFRLICLFHTFFRCGGYRAVIFAPLRCPKLFLIPICRFLRSSFRLFCSSLISLTLYC